MSNNQAGFDHAVVIGASMAGLLAAVGAAQSFRQVTVIDRDILEDTASPRRGVPQGSSIHVLLPAGLNNIESLLPGFRHDLLNAGAQSFDESADLATITSVGWRLRVKAMEWIGCRRPLLELVVRRRVQALPNVEFKQASVGGLSISDDRTAVTGVQLRDGTVIEADFVINATGRRTKAGDWLASLGFEAPPETFCNSRTAYATQFVRLPEDAFDHGLKGFVGPTWPGEHRGVNLFPVDNGLHALAGIGSMGNVPPRNRDELVEYIAGGTLPLVAEIARKAEPVGEINVYHVEGSLFRRWEKVTVPDRFVTVGDAAASLNPTFGQGMSLSAAAGVMIKDQLANAEDLNGLSGRIRDELAVVLESAFEVAASSDSSYQGAEWSDDYTPKSTLDAQRGIALDVLATQDPQISYVINTALYNLRPQDLSSKEIISRCDEWLSEGHELSSFDRNQYPVTVHEVTPLEGSEHPSVSSVGVPA